LGIICGLGSFVLGSFAAQFEDHLQYRRDAFPSSSIGDEFNGALLLSELYFKLEKKQKLNILKETWFS